MSNAFAILLAVTATAAYAWLVGIPGIREAKREYDQKMAAIAEERRAMEARHRAEREELEKWKAEVEKAPRKRERKKSPVKS